MIRAPQSQGCAHNRTPHRLRPIPPAQIQPSAILKSQISRECNAGSLKTTTTYDRHALSGHYKSTKTSRIKNTRASNSP